ncbi:MAG: hypothetical protein ACRECE_03825 [Xanthobacteraceae bacterium]
MTKACATTAVLVTMLAVAGCSSFPSFGGTKHPQPVTTVDANIYPANYRRQIAVMLRTTLTDRAEFNGALISPPALKSVADSPNPHYVVCLQLNGHDGLKTKVVIYLAGSPTQYIDATPQECGDAAYQPFTELQYAKPAK